MIRFGYRTASVKDINKAAKILLAKELGLDAVELALGEIKSVEEAKEWRELSEGHGISINSCGLGINLCNPAVEEISDKAIMSAIENSRILGINVFFTRTFQPPIAMPQKQAWEYLTKKTKQYARLCSEYGIKFAIEIDPPCFVNTLERVVNLLDNVNDDNLYVNYDPTNMYVCGSNPITAIKMLKDRISGGHIKDGIYRTEYKGETNIGFGEMDYKEIFSTLIEEGIDITMYYEHLKSSAEVKAAHKYISNIFKSLTVK